MAMTLFALTLLVIWDLYHPNPILNLRLLGERNFLVCGLLIYLSFAVLYGSNINLPQMLQELCGYDATLLDRRSQFHQARLAEHVRPANPWLDPMVEQLTRLRIARGGVSSVLGHDQALGLLSRMVREQARVIAYLDIFWLFWLMIVATIPLVFFMKRSVAKGELAAH
jgi:hypothetical protein